MANLKEVRKRINSIRSTQQITNAMKMVAASKLRRTQHAITALKPYSQKQDEILNNVLLSLSSNDNEAENKTINNTFAQEREVKNALIIVVASNKGLCGPFNSNTIKMATDYLLEKQNSDYNTFVLPVGRKVKEFFAKTDYKLYDRGFELADNPSYDSIKEFADLLLNDYKDEKIDKIEIIYNEFINASSQKITLEQFLPITNITADADFNSNIDYIFQPDKDEIISELVPNTLRIKFYKYMLNSITSEHGARMTAMSQATENASGLIKELQLSYNKARQAAITNEIIEIVSGAEALKQ
ncbi:MAG: ATP synthase F1 subunit gamma [Bacteroidales bacterium]|jgi:F-type H+-transporting ATPase subunit gamma